jgi:bile acid:Na+ symporter, BASS family
MTSATIIRILTISALAGLLGAVGLRLTLGEVLASLKKCRFTAILLANFIVIPALTAGLAVAFKLDWETTTAMILLGAAPFAPVVPVFARLARADLALAAGLTSVFPVLSAVLTPVVCQITLSLLPGTHEIHFSFLGVLLTLVATITLPLALGVWLHHRAPALSQRWLRPVEIVSEATGALSLTFVTVTEFGSIRQMAGPALVGMVLVFEAAVALGYWLGGPAAPSRWVVALGTSNRNIALALLVAIQSFANTTVVSAVVGNGLLLILLGLLHVGYWRFKPRNAPLSTP